VTRGSGVSVAVLRRFELACAIHRLIYLIVFQAFLVGCHVPRVPPRYADPPILGPNCS
jgi:hypothetical protein